MNLTKQKILITGGSSGIGLEIAREFVKKGNSVAICGSDLKKLKIAQSNIGAQCAIHCDLAEPSEVPRLVAEASKGLDGLSVLINNAGVQFNYEFSETNPNEVLLDAISEINVNLTSLIALSSACIPWLRKNEQAAIVNVSSGLAITPKASAPVYCATKAAVHSFTKALRYQLNESLPHIRVFEVMPPLVNTAMTNGRGDEGLRPEEVADEFFSGFSKDKLEMKVGKVKMLSILNRLWPSYAASQLRDS